MHVTAQHIRLVSSSCRAHSILIYFPVPQSLFHLAVTDEVQLCLFWKGKRRRRRQKKSLLECALSWAIKDDWTFHVLIWRMRNRQIASVPCIENPGGKGTACVKCFMEFHSTRRWRSHTLLTKHTESVDSSTLCSIRARVHLKPQTSNTVIKSIGKLICCL